MSGYPGAAAGPRSARRTGAARAGRRPSGRRAAGRRAAGLVAAAALVSGCELQEITVATPEDVVVVDALVQVMRFSPSSVEVLLRRTESGVPVEVPGAMVVVTLPDGEELVVPESATSFPCTQHEPPGGPGTCYARTLPRVGEGMRLDLRVETDRGEVLFASTTVPESFDLIVGYGAGGVCGHPADTPLELVWTRSEGAWAYIAETRIRGLREALEPLGIPVDEDPLDLLGLALSAADTTIVFPGEFGVFDRADLDRDLAVYLQGGVPAPTESRVTITAVDRNYVNWVRGGNFNPSGLVRVPSVRGDGTGFFGSGVIASQLIVVEPEFEGSTCRGPFS